jgi:hypothetical protein
MRAVNDLSVTAVISPVNRIEVFRGIRTHADRQNLHRQEYRRLGKRALRQQSERSGIAYQLFSAMQVRILLGHSLTRTDVKPCNLRGISRTNVQVRHHYRLRHVRLVR